MQQQWKPTKRWWNAYAALHGNAEVIPAKPKKKRNRDEEVEQEKFNKWFDEVLLNLGYRWFHPPNGGHRSLTEGAKFKRMGVKRGVPDIVVPMARKGRHGLVIELKRIDGNMSDLSEEQKDWLRWFKSQNWSTHVAFGFEHAKRIVEGYFKPD